MSHNTFGHLFRVTTWGESHGPAIGCVVDGCPPGLPLTAADIQYWLNRRKPGTSRFVTQRREPDEVKILSGVFSDDRTEGPLTTGAPISLLIENVDQRGKDYDDIRDLYRPGHADYVYDAKYGLRDYRGGGPFLGARDRRARGRRRDRAARAGRGRADPRRFGADRRHRHRPRALGLGRGREQPVLVPGRRDRHAMGGAARPDAQGRQLGRRRRRSRSRPACPPAGARRSMASSTPRSPAR